MAYLFLQKNIEREILTYSNQSIYYIFRNKYVAGILHTLHKLFSHALVHNFFHHSLKH